MPPSDETTSGWVAFLYKWQGIARTIGDIGVAGVLVLAVLTIAPLWEQENAQAKRQNDLYERRTLEMEARNAVVTPEILKAYYESMTAYYDAQVAK